MPVTHGYTTTGTNSAARQVSKDRWNADHVTSFWVDITEDAYGADPTGVTSSTAAINAALAAVAAQGYYGGGICFMPPGRFVLDLGAFATELLRITGVGPVVLRGSGYISTVLVVKATVGATVDAIRIVPNTAGLQGIILEDFQIAVESGTPGRNALNIDTTTFSVSRLRINRVYFAALGGKGIVQTNPTPLTDGFYQSSVRDSVIYNGIALQRAGDSLTIEGNTFAGANIGVDASFVAGASAMVIRENNITNTGGAVHLGASAADTRIVDNFIEGHLNDPGSNSASIDIDGAVGELTSNVSIRGNLIVPISTGLNCIRVNRANATHIDDNTLIRPGPGSNQIAITANATNTRIRPNRLSPTTDTLLSQGLSDLGANTQYDFIDHGAKQERTKRAMVRATRGTTFAVTSGAAEVAVPWTGEDYDTDSLHTTGGNNTRLQAPYVGKYILSLTIQWEFNAAGERLVEIRNQAGTIVAAERISADAAAATIQTISAHYFTTAATDYFEAFVFQNCGAPLNVDANGIFGSNFSLAYLGD